MNVTAVIGANFGDEGKGLMTDYFSDKKTVVVRHNGGAQAGHTVVTPDGIRHVFSHFGSGTLAGAATFLGPRFIINPLLWKKELGILKKMGFDPKVFYAGGLVTTPYDMLINEEIERSRGDGRHGSCGVGINETVTRHYSEKFAFPRLRIDSKCNILTRNKIVNTVKIFATNIALLASRRLDFLPRLHSTVFSIPKPYLNVMLTMLLSLPSIASKSTRMPRVLELWAFILAAKSITLCLKERKVSFLMKSIISSLM